MVRKLHGKVKYGGNRKGVAKNPVSHTRKATKNRRCNKRFR
jgi:hypothetical protein